MYGKPDKPKLDALVHDSIRYFRECEESGACGILAKATLFSEMDERIWNEDILPHLGLQEDEVLLRKYKRHQSEGKHWPEVIESILSPGSS